MKIFLYILCYSFLFVLTQILSASDAGSAGIYKEISASDGTDADSVELLFTVQGGAPRTVNIYKSETANRDSAVALWNTLITLYEPDPNLTISVSDVDSDVIPGRTYYYWGQVKYGDQTEWTDYDTGYAGSSPGTIQFSASSASVSENAGSVRLSVTRSGGSSGAASVNYATANGTASAGTDYTATSSQLTWANGNSDSKSITVPILDDSVADGDKTFTVSLSSPSGASLGSLRTNTVTIVDNEEHQISANRNGMYLARAWIFYNLTDTQPNYGGRVCDFLLELAQNNFLELYPNYGGAEASGHLNPSSVRQNFTTAVKKFNENEGNINPSGYILYLYPWLNISTMITDLTDPTVRSNFVADVSALLELNSDVIGITLDIEPFPDPSIDQITYNACVSLIEELAQECRLGPTFGGKEFQLYVNSIDDQINHGEEWSINTLREISNGGHVDKFMWACYNNDRNEIEEWAPTVLAGHPDGVRVSVGMGIYDRLTSDNKQRRDYFRDALGALKAYRTTDAFGGVVIYIDYDEAGTLTRYLNSEIWDAWRETWLEIINGPVISAYSSRNNFSISSEDDLIITVQIDPGQYSGINADWWVVAIAPSGWYYLNPSMQWTPFDGNLDNTHPAYQGPLFNLAQREIVRCSGLPTGSYTIYFGVDIMDGLLNANNVWYNSVTFTITSPLPPPPSAPAGVSASDGAYTNKMRVTWNTVSDATSYEVWRNTRNISSSASKLTDTSATNYDDSSVITETTYYYWIKANNANGTSEFSSSDSGYLYISIPYEIKNEDVNAVYYHLGNFYTGELGIGQSIKPYNYCHATNFAFYISSCELLESNRKLVLHVRESNGNIIQMVEQYVPTNYVGWIYIDTDVNLKANNTYIMTCYIKNTYSGDSGIHMAQSLKTYNPYSDGEPYYAYSSVPGVDFDDFSYWGENSLTSDCNFWLRGYTIPPF